MSVEGWEAWAVYGVASVGLLACLWYVTRPFFVWIRRPLRVVAVVFLFMPWTVAADIKLLSPAWLTAVFDGLLKEDASFARAGAPLLVALLLALSAALVSVWLQRHKEIAT